MKLNLRLICTINMVLACLFIFAKDGYSDEVRGVTDQHLRIAAILDQTGPAANVTVPITNAFRSFFGYVNESGGIHGRNIKLIVEDDRYSIPGGIAAFKKVLYKDQVLAMIGPTHSGALGAVFRHIDRERIPTLSTAPNENTVSPLKRYIFGVYETYPHMIKTLIGYMLEDLNPHDPKIALIYPDNEAGKLDLAAAIERLHFLGHIPVVKEVLNPGSIDATSQVMNLKRYKVNNIVLCGFIPQPAGVLLRELKKFGLNIPVFANVAAASEEVINMAGPAANRYFVVSPFASWYDEGTNLSLMRRITLKYAPGTEKPYRGKLYTFGWSIVTVLREGLVRAGKSIDGDGLVKALETLNNFDMRGLSGPINFSSTNHKGMNSSRIFKSDPESGKFVPITEWRISK